MLRLSFVALGFASFLSSISPAVADNTGKHGAVVSQSAVCSNIGLDILKQGGNAADAIIATCLCIGTTSGYHSGIGGGGFMIVRYNTSLTTHDYQTIDFRERMPAAGDASLYVNASTNPNITLIGGLAVAVPGELRGLETLHGLHGKLPWKTLFQPSIKLARDGFQVDGALEDRLNATRYPFLLTDKLFADVFAPNGVLLKKGDTAVRLSYANTLEGIAEHGADYFYNGDIAKNTVQAIQARKGVVTANDLTNYTALVRAAANITYRDHRLFSTVAPSSGSMVLSNLKIFEGYPADAQPTDPAINLTTHRIIQGARFSAAQRLNLGDPAFTANVSVLEQLFLDESTVEKIRGRISDTQTFPNAYYDIDKYIHLNHFSGSRETSPQVVMQASGIGAMWSEGISTMQDTGELSVFESSHMSAADASGISITLASTVNSIWGSQIMTQDGIILNSEVDQFDAPGVPSPANGIAPFKRPLSTMALAIAEDLKTGQLRIVTGAAGGLRTITAVGQCLSHQLDQKMETVLAQSQPRWTDFLSTATYYEDGNPNIAPFSASTMAYLKGLGYNNEYQNVNGSRVQVITVLEDGDFFTASDPRSPAAGGVAY